MKNLLPHKTIVCLAAFVGLLLTACQDSDDLTGGGSVSAEKVIHIGGIDADELVAHATVTRGEGGAIDEDSVQRTDAENISWLVGPLKAGLDITYGNFDSNGERTNSRVAILTLLTETNGSIKYSVDGDKKYAEYSFLYRDDQNGNPTNIPAIWYDNGAHFFEGLHIPDRIKYRNYPVEVTVNEETETLPAQTVESVYDTSGSAVNLSSDQHDDAQFSTSENDLGNYTLLSHYLGMPSNFTLNATVARVKLPFRHRLARVLAYILIDPDMGDGVQIKGYKKDANEDETTDEDATTSMIRFCNVKVLAGVKDSYNFTTKHHTYTPQWMQVRKAIPHFVGERGSYDDSQNKSLNNDHFISYYDTQKKEYVYPTDASWANINKTFPVITGTETEKTVVGNYERTIYGKVPCYDLIVQPTYTQLNRVMYDEEGVENAMTKQNLYAATNQIEFEITLNNGLQYSKVFNFDLDANYQTVVYLHISRERVDYNSSGSDLWVESTGYDDWYGVNNQNGNTLSFAGSSWQRAYTCGTIPEGTEHPNNFDDVVTDGHFYKYDPEDEKAQYVTDAKWIEMFAQACEGGLHHGDYFILHHNISISASDLPDNFVFTGHLDGQDHTITLTGTTFERVKTQAYDEYVTWTEGGGTKFVHVSGDTYEAASGTYYQYDGGETYTKIDVLNDYASATAYTREEHQTVSHTIIDKSNVLIGTTYYQLVNQEYVAIVFNAADEIANFTDDIYIRTEEVSYTYTEVTFYQFVHHDAEMETVNRGNLLAGLNGKYTTIQESDDSKTWEANVHREKVGNTVYWVPYKNDTDGWRAEIINTNISGGTLFPSSVYNTETKQYTGAVTGYVHNCWINGTFSGTPPKWSGTKVPDYTPSLPVY